MAKREPRGIRNNNPGNIRRSSSFWRGEVGNNDDQVDYGEDSAFEVYSEAKYGLRALARVLLNYQRVHGLRTLEEIIDRWAPPVENDTGAYVAHVAKIARLHPRAILDLASDRETFIAVIEGIVMHENGMQPYSRGQIEAGIVMALA